MTDAQATIVAGQQAVGSPSAGALSIRETTIAVPQQLPPVMYPGTRMEQDAEGGISGRRLLHALRRRWLPATVLGTLLAVACAVPTYLLLPRGYQAVVWLRVRGSATLLGGGADRGEYEAYRKTQIQLLKSPVVLNAALRRPGIAALRTITDEDDPLRWLETHLEAATQSDSEILQLKLRAPVAEEAAKILNAVTACYLDDIVNQDRKDRLTRRDTLEKKYRDNQTELLAKKESLISLGKTLNSRDSDEVATTKTLTMEQLSHARNLLYEYQREQRELEGELQAAAALKQEQVDGGNGEGEDSDELLAGTDDVVEATLSRVPEVQSLEERIIRLGEAIDSQSLRSARGMNEPAVKRMISQKKSLVEQLQRVKERLRPQVEKMLVQSGADRGTAKGLSVARLSPALLKVRREMLAKSIDDTQREIDDLTVKVKALGQANADLEIRRADIEQLEAVTRQIGLQLESTAIDLTAPARVMLLEEAAVPNDDEMLKRVLLTALVGLGGLVFGAATVLSIEYARNRLSSPDEIPQAVGLKVVGTIPWIGSSRRERESEYRVAESVDGIRTMLLQGNGVREAPKVILVTSPGEREGKSSLAANLAASIARSDKRTLLVEGSLRNPSVHAALQLDPSVQGIAELLRQEVEDPNSVVQPTQIDGLFAVGSGNCDYDAIAALSRPGLGKIIRSYRETFDHVIIDAGSVHASADPLIFGQHCDVALLAAMRDVSSMPSICAAVDRLRSAGVRIAGCVVCGTREAGPAWKQRRIAS